MELSPESIAIEQEKEKSENEIKEFLSDQVRDNVILFLFLFLFYFYFYFSESFYLFCVLFFMFYLRFCVLLF